MSEEFIKDDELENMIRSVRKEGNYQESFKTVFDRLFPEKNQDKAWKWYEQNWIHFDEGDPNLIASSEFDPRAMLDGYNTVKGGLDKMIIYLAEGLKIDLNQPVDSIDYSGDRIQVSHNGVITEADAVLVTVPIGVLQHGSIKFTPALPEPMQKAISSVGICMVNKFLLTWDSCFWDDSYYIFYLSEESQRFTLFSNMNFVHRDQEVNALVAFAYGEHAIATESQSDEEIIAEIMVNLRKVYGEGIPEPKTFARTKWNSNIFARGCYSYPKVGSKVQVFDELKNDIEQKVFFAGEHTVIEQYGMIDAALLSGEREARRILEVLKMTK